MATPTLRRRRILARGINGRLATILNGRYFSGIGNRATLTTALSGANNDITLIARTPGTGGNSITLTIAVSGNNTALSSATVGSDITVTAATDGSGVATSTAAEVIKAIQADAAAMALVWPQIAAGNDGTGAVVALTQTALTGAS